MLKRLSESELQGILNEQEAIAESASAETVRKLRRFLKRYIRNFKAVLADAAVAESAKIELAEQEQIVRSITELLVESGYREVVQEFERSLSVVGESSIRYFKEYFDRTPTFGGAAKEMLDALAGNLLDELDFQVNNKIVRPLESAVRNSVLALETRQAQVADIAKVITEEGILRRDGREFTQANIEVLVSDAPRRFGQQVRNEQAAELGLEVFVYSGPLDSVTSEQCQFLLTAGRHGVGNFWYRDEIQIGMHPKLKANPLVARGHYGCRHAWMPIDEDGAQRLNSSFRPRGE